MGSKTWKVRTKWRCRPRRILHANLHQHRYRHRRRVRSNHGGKWLSFHGRLIPPREERKDFQLQKHRSVMGFNLSQQLLQWKVCLTRPAKYELLRQQWRSLGSSHPQLRSHRIRWVLRRGVRVPMKSEEKWRRLLSLMNSKNSYLYVFIYLYF